MKLALDVGCGKGTLEARRYKDCEFIGIDIVIEKERRIKTVLRADAHYMPFRDRTFDYIVAHHVLEHVYHPLRVLQEIKRIWNGNGEIFIEVPNGRRLELVESETHIYSWIPQTFRQFLRLVFEEIEVLCVHPAPFIRFNYRLPILGKTINGFLNAIVYLLFCRKEPHAIRAFIKSKGD